MKQMNYSIPKPCSEDFSNMTPTEKGAFCKRCTKEVIDFTQFSKSEIESYLINHSTEGVCGRMKKTQFQDAGGTVKMKLPYSVSLLKIASALAVLPLTDFAISQENGIVYEQSEVEIISQRNLENPTGIIRVLSTQVKGRVFDKVTNELLPFVKVILNVNDTVLTAVETDLDGFFEFEIPEKVSLEEDAVFINIRGYDYADISVDLKERNVSDTLEIGLEPNQVIREVEMLGVIEYKHPKWQKFKSIVCHPIRRIKQKREWRKYER